MDGPGPVWMPCVTPTFGGCPGAALKPTLSSRRDASPSSRMKLPHEKGVEQPQARRTQLQA